MSDNGYIEREIEMKNFDGLDMFVLALACALGTGFIVGNVAYVVGAKDGVDKVIAACYDKKEYVLEKHESVNLTLQCSVVLK